MVDHICSRLSFTLEFTKLFGEINMDICNRQKKMGTTSIKGKDLGVLFLRLSLSFLFFAHIYWKFTVKGFIPWWQGMDEAGYPVFVSLYTLAIEFSGAVFLLLGIYTRQVCLLALPVMIAVAYHWAIRKGFWFTLGGAELPVVWSFMLIAQILLGDGPFALKRSPPFLYWVIGPKPIKRRHQLVSQSKK
jgi:putative oxidoreductase